MTNTEIIELLKVSGPMIISIFGFGFIYKIMNEKISVYKDREDNYKRQFELFEKVKDTETNLWKTKAEELAKQLADKIKTELHFNQLEISKPNLLTNSLENKNTISKYLDFFQTIGEGDIKQYDFNTETLVMIHMYFYGIKEYEKASIALMEAIKKDQFNSNLYSYQAGTLKKLGRIEEAINFCNKSISLNNSNPDAYYNLATLYALKGEQEQAKKYATKTIELNPDFKRIIINSHYFHNIKIE